MLKKLLLIIIFLLVQINLLFPQEIDSLQKLKNILSLPQDKIDVTDVLIAELMIDKIIDPSINIQDYPKKIDEIIKEIKKIAGNKNVSCKDINTFLYEKGDWNHNQVYRYQLDDPLGGNVKTFLLSTYLDSKKGNCTSMPLLYFLIARQLNFNVYVARTPHHMYIQAFDQKGVTWNIEPTNKGHSYQTAYYIEHFVISTASIQNKIYLVPLTNKEVISVLLSKLQLYYMEKKEFKKALYVCDLAIKSYPKNVSAISNKWAIYTRTRTEAINAAADQRLLKLESGTNYYDWLEAQAKKYRKIAEDLGWRERSEEDEKKYLQSAQIQKQNLAKEEANK